MFAWTDRSFLAGVLAVALTAAAAPAANSVAETERIRKAGRVLESLVATPDSSIPKYVLERAEAIVVIPRLVKGGLVVGAEHGAGVMSVRQGGSWSLPSFVKMTGGSIGWQIGAEAVDLVLVVLNRDGVDELLRNEFTLGAQAGIAAGPVGRSAEASTDALMSAKILTYSRAKGLFVGATFEGASLRDDVDANQTFYGKRLSARQLFERKPAPVTAPPEASAWRTLLTSVVPEKGSGG
jgi:lipid-binding SYLF domain-containing protein